MSYKLEIPNKDMHLLLLLGYFFICMRESELKEVLVLQLSKTSFFFFADNKVSFKQRHFVEKINTRVTRQKRMVKKL